MHWILKHGNIVPICRWFTRFGFKLLLLINLHAAHFTFIERKKKTPILKACYKRQNHHAIILLRIIWLFTTLHAVML